MQKREEFGISRLHDSKNGESLALRACTIPKAKSVPHFALAQYSKSDERLGYMYICIYVYVYVYAYACINMYMHMHMI